jgi:hypothetical protein
MADLISTTRAQQDVILAALDASQLASAISAASSFVEKYCNRTFIKAALSETYDGNGSARLLLDQPNSPLPSSLVITDPSDDSSTTYDSTTTPTISDALEIDNAQGILRFKSSDDSTPGIFTHGFQNVVVSWTPAASSPGLATTADDLPQDLQEAVVQVASKMSSVRFDTSPYLQSWSLGRYSQNKGGRNTPLATGMSLLDDHIRQLLAPYRDII